MTPEGKTKAAIRRWLDRHGYWYFCPAANGFGKGGIPDFIVCLNGRFVAIEAKRLGNEDGATELQKVRIKEINAAGGIAFVADRVETVEAKLKWLMT